jgi:hypothetical protein
MSDYRDTRGGVCDHVNEFGNPQPPQVKDKETRIRRRNGARTCNQTRYRDQTKATRSLSAYVESRRDL